MMGALFCLPWGGGAERADRENARLQDHRGDGLDDDRVESKSAQGRYDGDRDQ